MKFIFSPSSFSVCKSVFLSIYTFVSYNCFSLCIHNYHFVYILLYLHIAPSIYMRVNQYSCFLLIDMFICACLLSNHLSAPLLSTCLYLLTIFLIVFLSNCVSSGCQFIYISRIFYLLVYSIYPSIITCLFVFLFISKTCQVVSI